MTEAHVFDNLRITLANNLENGMNLFHGIFFRFSEIFKVEFKNFYGKIFSQFLACFAFTPRSNHNSSFYFGSPDDCGNIGIGRTWNLQETHRGYGYVNCGSYFSNFDVFLSGWIGFWSFCCY